MKSIKINFYLQLIGILFSHFVYSQTEFSGGIFENTVWTKANSPYIITGNIALYPGYQLQIESGVQIKFNSNTKFIVRGDLVIQGAEGDSVVFTSNNNFPQKGQWQGIDLENNNGGTITGSYFVGNYADRFIEIIGSSSGQVIDVSNAKICDNNFGFYGYDGTASFSVSLANSTVIRNDYGYIYATNLTITNCLFSAGDKGVHGWDGRNIVITNSEFSYFSTWPFNLEGDISNTRIHHNAVGIRMKPQLYVTNCIIAHNTIGVSAEYPIPVPGTNISGNKICDNTAFNFEHRYSYAVNIPNNCWCSDNENTIAEGILDAFDNVDLGIVTFTPLMNCPPNTPPAVISYLGPTSLEEDHSIQFELNNFKIIDPDNILPDDFSITLLEGDHYTISNSILIPNVEYSGPLSIAVLVNDGVSDSEPFEFDIQVTPVNDIPVILAYNGILEIDKNSSINFQLEDFSIIDADNNFPNDHSLTILAGDHYTFSNTNVTPALDFVGQFSVSMLINDGNSESEPYEVTLTSNEIVLSVEKDEDLIFVYPNPFLNQIFIENRSGLNIISIEIIDVLGKNVFSQHFEQQLILEPLSIDLKSMETGIYLMKINSQQGKLISVRVERK